MTFEEQVETVATALSGLDSASDRRKVWFMYLQDVSYSRGALCEALNRLELSDDFEYREVVS